MVTDLEVLLSLKSSSEAEVAIAIYESNSTNRSLSHIPSWILSLSIMISILSIEELIQALDPDGKLREEAGQEETPDEEAQK